ncbi:MAG: hypothetical protein FJ271_20210 [Planctomycetes bacterium]|nr:hypothetical protein [Planctomycetota bacterium]
MPSISYAAYPSGTWAYNHDTSQWRQLTRALPLLMSGNGGLNRSLYASYNSGTWHYNFTSSQWTQLSRAKPVALSNGAPTLFASYNSGTFQVSSGQWRKLTGAVATQIVAVGPGAFYATFASGLWHWDSSAAKRWTQLTRAVPRTMAWSSSLFVSLNSGTWSHTFAGGWTRLTTAVATEITDIERTNSFYATYASGTWRYLNGSWTQLTRAVARSIESGEKGVGQGSVFVGSFNSGTWTFQDGAWMRITRAVATSIA